MGGGFKPDRNVGGGRADDQTTHEQPWGGGEEGGVGVAFPLPRVFSGGDDIN